MKASLARFALIAAVLCGCADTAGPQSAGAGGTAGTALGPLAEPARTDASQRDAPSHIDNASQGDSATAVDDGGRMAGPFEPEEYCTPGEACPTSLSSGALTCVRFAGTDGPTACVRGPVPSIDCALPRPSPYNECCSDDDCGTGHCRGNAGPVCEDGGSTGVTPKNVCVPDECASDADCGAGSTCTPEGYGDARRCIPAACLTSADCTAAPGGQCVFLAHRCLSTDTLPGGYAAPQLFCLYPDDVCRSDGDCGDKGRLFCLPQGQRLGCKDLSR